MLLGVTFSEFITKINVIIGIVVCAFGFASLIIAKRLAQAVEKDDEVYKSSKTYVTTKIVGLVLILVGMIVIALPF